MLARAEKPASSIHGQLAVGPEIAQQVEFITLGLSPSRKRKGRIARNTNYAHTQLSKIGKIITNGTQLAGADARESEGEKHQERRFARKTCGTNFLAVLILRGKYWNR